MRIVSADKICPMVAKPIINGAIVLADDGTILDLLLEHQKPTESEYFDGILIPGFVNAHCHLELSHLEGKIKRNSGLPEFVKQLTNCRNQFTKDEIASATLQADQRMKDAGIAAVGDISNTADSIMAKSLSHLRYHTFVESIGVLPGNAEAAWSQSELLLQKFRSELPGHSASIAPHAPYSVSARLMQQIAQRSARLTMHNQECDAEDEFFTSGKGLLFDLMSDYFKIDLSFWKPTKQSSLQSVLPFLNSNQPIILVHNTKSRAEDIEAAELILDNAYWCLCPNANLYIENSLPDIRMLRNHQCSMVIGTDSLASNGDLDILSELRVIKQAFPEIPDLELLTWATWNGAQALGMDGYLGVLKKGIKPRVIGIHQGRIEEEISVIV